MLETSESKRILWHFLRKSSQHWRKKGTIKRAKTVLFGTAIAQIIGETD
jgi:hypothetical protein